MHKQHYLLSQSRLPDVTIISLRKHCMVLSAKLRHISLHYLNQFISGAG